MPQHFSKSIQHDFKHHRPKAMVLRVLSFVSAAFLISGAAVGLNLVYKQIRNNRIADRLSAINAVADYSASAGGAGGAMQPVRLEIPAINLNAPIIPVGVDASNSLEIPEQQNQVGWYAKGPLPGQKGSAVIDGHLDTAGGPAIFWRLSKLRPNDQIKVFFSDGSEKDFTVFDKKNFPQNNFPSALVYADPGFAGLNLITCSGIYSKTVGRYSDNLVIFSKLD